MLAYSEDPNTISLYPAELYDEDLTPDIGYKIDNYVYTSSSIKIF